MVVKDVSSTNFVGAEKENGALKYKHYRFHLIGRKFTVLVKEFLNHQNRDFVVCKGDIEKQK